MDQNRPSDPDPRTTLTVTEAGRLLGIHDRSTAYALVKAGTFPALTFRAGRRIIVSRSSVESLVGAEAVSAFLASTDDKGAAA